MHALCTRFKDNSYGISLSKTLLLLFWFMEKMISKGSNFIKYNIALGQRKSLISMGHGLVLVHTDYATFARSNDPGSSSQCCTYINSNMSLVVKMKAMCVCP